MASVFANGVHVLSVVITGNVADGFDFCSFARLFSLLAGNLSLQISQRAGWLFFFFFFPGGAVFIQRLTSILNLGI
jgi:hypothetical protein